MGRMKTYTALASLAVVLAVAAAKFIPRDIPDDCKYFTVGGCSPATDEIIETYDIPNVENAISLCQQVCQIQEGCNYFTYNKDLEKCYLFHYRYLDSCQLIGGTAEPMLDEKSLSPLEESLEETTLSLTQIQAFALSLTA